MKTDTGVLGCFAAVVVIGLLVVGAIYLTERIGESTTQREFARAEIERERTAQLETRLDHKETMYMLWTTTLASFESSFGLLDVVGLLAIAVLALLSGMALGHWLNRAVM